MEKERKDLQQLFCKGNGFDYINPQNSSLYEYIKWLEDKILTPTQDKATFLKAADERIIPNIKDHYFSHDMISEEGQYIELYEVYDILKWAFETLTKKQK